MGCSCSALAKSACCRGPQFRATVAPEPGVSIKTSESDEVFHQPLNFTEAEKALVKKTWKVLANDLKGRGSKVFIAIFRANPAIKALFPFDGMEGEVLMKSTLFKGHASRFMQAVGAVVDNIDSLDEALSPLLLGLGKHHVLFPGFEPVYFNSFQTGMRQVWAEDLGSKFNAHAQQAWDKVFEFIMHKLKEGYLAGLHEYAGRKNTMTSNIGPYGNP